MFILLYKNTCCSFGGPRCNLIFFPLSKEETNSIGLFKQQTQRNVYWDSVGWLKGLEVKHNRTWLKIKTLAKQIGEMSVKMYCGSQQGIQIDLNRGVEWWINGYSGLVTPSHSTSPPINERPHTDMAPYTPFCFYLLLECCTLVFHIQLKEGENASSCNLGI